MEDDILDVSDPYRPNLFSWSARYPSDLEPLKTWMTPVIDLAPELGAIAIGYGRVTGVAVEPIVVAAMNSARDAGRSPNIAMSGGGE